MTVNCKSLFQKQLNLYLSLLGYPVRQYSGHSFRSGSATTAAVAGLRDWEIKLLGRWTSSTYQGYIRTPKSVMASLSKRLIHVDTISQQIYDHENPYVL